MKHFFALSLILLALTSWIYTEADAQEADTTPPTLAILPVIEDNHRNFFPNYYTDERIREKGLIYNGDEFKVRIVFSEELLFPDRFTSVKVKNHRHGAGNDNRVGCRG